MNTQNLKNRIIAISLMSFFLLSTITVAVASAVSTTTVNSYKEIIVELEQVEEEVLEIESWMVDDAYWSTSEQNENDKESVKSSKDQLDIGSWIVDDDLWRF